MRRRDIAIDIAIRGGLVALPGGCVSADIGVTRGRIEMLAPDIPDAAETIDASSCVVLPGGVDPHTHLAVGDPSHFQPVIEGIKEATRTALRGGITTLGIFVHSGMGAADTDEMLRNLVTEGLAEAYTDFFVTLVCPPEANPAEVVRSGTNLGVSSYKAMLGYERRGLMLRDRQLVELMKAVAATDGLLVVHAENGGVAGYLEDELRRDNPDPSWDSYLQSSPGCLEAEAVFRASTLARLCGCRLLFAHLSAGEAVETARWLRTQNLGESAVAWETQPHYLLLTDDEVKRRGPLAKVGPPLREDSDRRAVLAAVREGLVSHLSSDHAPRNTELKLAERSIFDAPYGGTSGVELFSPLAHRIVREEAGLGWEDLARLTATNAARRYGLGTSKGALLPGADADMCVLPVTGEPRRVRAEELTGVSDYSLYEGVEYSVTPRFVIRAGQVAVAEGTDGERVPARYLARGRTVRPIDAQRWGDGDVKVKG